MQAMKLTFRLCLHYRLPVSDNRCMPYPRYEGGGGLDHIPPNDFDLMELSRMGQAVLLRTKGALAEIIPEGASRLAHYDLVPDTVVSLWSAAGDISMRVSAASWINQVDRTYRLDQFLACYSPASKTRFYSERIELYRGDREIPATSQEVQETTNPLLIDAIVDAHDLGVRYDDNLSAPRLERFTKILQVLYGHRDPSEILTHDFLPAMIAEVIRPISGED